MSAEIIPLPVHIIEAILKLEAYSTKEVLTAIVKYWKTGSEPRFSESGAALWAVIRQNLDDEREQYMERCRQNRENGKKGGRPRKKTDEKTENRPVLDHPKKDTKKPTGFEVKKAVLEAPKTERFFTSCMNAPTPSRKVFRKPTVDEVSAYCSERKNGINAQDFCDFYESKGWVVGKSPMKDWRAAVRTWERSRTPSGGTEQQGYRRNRNGAVVGITDQKQIDEFERRAFGNHGDHNA